MKNFIYLDNAATTQVKEAVLQSMLPFFREIYGNPSADHGFARKAKEAVEKARVKTASLIGAKAEEIYFTSGGSESDNWAVKAVAEAYKDKGKHIITSKIEHHAVLHTCEYLEKMGYEITYLDVDEDGKIRLDELEKSVREDTILISVMAANNEIGTIQPITEIGRIAYDRGVFFHTDAVQAYGHIPLNVTDMNADLLSASGHKFGGPKGVGFLYIKRDVGISSLIHGGAQERSRRAGTYNTPGIVGMGEAAAIAKAKMEENMRKQILLRDYLIGRVLGEIPDVRLNGHKYDRLPGNANFSFASVKSESLLILLDKLGICASGGSACTSGSTEPSHVLTAIGLSGDMAQGALRLTLSEETDKDEIDYVVENLKKITARLRGVS